MIGERLWELGVCWLMLAQDEMICRESILQ